jgi:hypothetical protein
MLALGGRGRVEHGRLLAGEHRRGAVVVDVDGVIQRTNERELVGDAGVQRQMLADRHARDARGDRPEDAAHLLRSVGLEVVGFEMAGPADAVHEDDRGIGS